MPEPSLAERIAALIEEAKPAEPPPQPEPIRPLAYTYKGAAKVTGLGISTLSREVRAGRLKVSKVRGRVLITDEELRRYLAANSG